MDEATKTNFLRGPEFTRTYLGGRVIDIGAGKDPVCPHAEPFDVTDGDANVITRYRDAGQYDAVHSSHCLEHMRDPVAALAEWWALLKVGGFLVLVVPDEDLYEQGIWPSAFNRDHKSTFRLDKAESWSPVSYDIRQLVGRLPGCRIVSAEVQDANYDHALKMKFGDRRRAKSLWLRIARKIGMHLPWIGRHAKIAIENLAVRRGVPLDQTQREAVAQIQVVAQKLG
jgi:SAM-dependent methyltransferase